MALHHNPRIVTDGLVLALDAADVNSSPQKQNYLRATEDFTNTSIWTPLNFQAVLTRTANDTAAPDGTQTADKLVKTSGNGIRQDSTVFRVYTGDTTTFGVWAKTDTTGSITLDIGDEGNTSFDLTSTWRYCKVTHTHTGQYGPSYNSVDISLPTDTPVYLWGARWYSGAEEKPYYPVGTNNTTVKNLAGSGDGTLLNGPLYKVDNRGMFELDGSNDHIPVVIPKTVTCTYVCWARQDFASTSDLGNMLFNAGENVQGPNLYFASSKIIWNTWDSAANPFCNMPSLVVDGNHHQYTVVCNASTQLATLYIDGVEYGTALHQGRQQSRMVATNNLYVGSSSYYWKGSIANFHMYNRALTAQEVLQNYNATKTRFGL